MCVDAKVPADSTSQPAYASRWMLGFVEDLKKDLPAEYQNAGSPIYVIDPTGKLLAMNVDGIAAFNLLDKMIKRAAPAEK